MPDNPQNPQSPQPVQSPQPPQTLSVDQPPKTVQPDGGVLGHAAMGALASATDAHNTDAPPQTLQIDPPKTLQVDGSPMKSWMQKMPAPDLGDSVSGVLDKILETTPIGQIHKVAGTVRDWADKKLNDPSNIANREGTMGSLDAAAHTFSMGATRDIASLVHGATSAKGIATAGAATVAAIPVGIYLAGTGIHDFVQGWSDIHSLADIMNPEKLQPILSAGAQTVGGLAGVEEGRGALVKAWKNAQAGIKDTRYEAFKKVFPPSSQTPYDESDWAVAQKRIMDEHMGGNTIDSSDPKTAIKAADAAITKIDNEITNKIKTNPNVEVHPDIFGQVRTRLASSQKIGFYEDAMKALEQYKGMGFERSTPGDIAHGTVDPPMTLSQADQLRHTMNADNRALTDALNKYDYSTLMETNPVFAARNIAAEAIRNAEYERLALPDFNMPNAADLRGVEGSVIKLRNAMVKKEFADMEKGVPGTGKKPSAVRKAAGKAANAATTVGSAWLGAHVAGTEGAAVGAFTGSQIGGALERGIAGQPLTREQLLEHAFGPDPTPTLLGTAKVKVGATADAAKTAGAGTAGAATSAAASVSVPKDHIHIVSSDGHDHIIPASELHHALEIDPNLKIVNQ